MADCLAFQKSFGGRNARFAEAWQTITKDPWILRTVSFGFCLDFVGDPTQSVIPNNARMTETQAELCDKEMHSLLEKGAVVTAQGEGFLSGIFLIQKKSGGYRPIINLKGLNRSSLLTVISRWRGFRQSDRRLERVIGSARSI